MEDKFPLRKGGAREERMKKIIKEEKCQNRWRKRKEIKAETGKDTKRCFLYLLCQTVVPLTQGFTNTYSGTVTLHNSVCVCVCVWLSGQGLSGGRDSHFFSFSS